MRISVHHIISILCTTAVESQLWYCPEALLQVHHELLPAPLIH